MIYRNPWPFREPRNRGVFITRQVLANIYPILCIVHESGTGGWRFLDLQKTEVQDLVGLTLEQVAEFLDPDVLEVAIGLPLYARATRDSVHDPWIREYGERPEPRKAKPGNRSGRQRREKD